MYYYIVSIFPFLYWLLQKLFSSMWVHKEETKTATVHSLEKPIKKFNVSVTSPFTCFGEGNKMEKEVIWSAVRVI